MQKAYPDPEKALWNPKLYAQPWLRRYYAIPRPVRLLIIAVALFAIIAGFIRHIGNNRDFALKQLPSDFTTLAQAQPDALWHAPHPVRQENGTHIDNQYIYMHHLRTGKEGSASLYVDVTSGEVVVVKTFWHSPKRHTSAPRWRLRGLLHELADGD